ncbi:hypothetical protein AGMMS50276_24600 [Synergistales bacterium]|nr:hypothetical protein AGMMS50276_24600 [Synergistales bacterium]
MSKNNKKKPQQNLSLKDRLAKHWNNRNWGAFVSLYMRDKEASERTIWKERWQYSLYNCLTNAFFVDRDFQSSEMAVDIIRQEGESASSLLRDCADVARDFLSSHKNACLCPPSPLRQEASLPPAYASLRASFASLVIDASKAKKSKKNEAVGLIEKLSAQYDRLEKAKSVSPYSTLLNIAEQLKTATADTPHADTFRAVSAIAAITRELVRGTHAENALRDADELSRHPLFRAIPPNQSHPVVGMLWDFFCGLGARKYGAEWGDCARVLRMSFMSGQSSQISAQYGRLMKAKGEIGDLLCSLLSEAGSRWTEQERYILRTLFATRYGDSQEEDDSFAFFAFLESFAILGKLGRKWRPEAPWTKPVQECFNEVLLGTPKKMLPAFAQMDLPFEAISAPGLLYLAISDRRAAQKIREAVGSKLPLKLSGIETRDVALALSEREIARKEAQTIRSLLDGDSYASLFTILVRELIIYSGVQAMTSDTSTAWASISRDLLEELAATLPPESVEACFCSLSIGAGHMSLSDDPSKVEAFFKALSSKAGLDTQEAKVSRVKMETSLFMLLLSWPNVSSGFLNRFFDISIPSHKEVARNIFGHWEHLACMVENMKDEPNRKAVAAFIYEKIKLFGEFKSADIKRAIGILEKLLGIAGKTKSKTPSRKKKTSFDILKAQLSLLFNEVLDRGLNKDFD